jgi:hypothetical protein
MTPAFTFIRRPGNGAYSHLRNRQRTNRRRVDGCQVQGGNAGRPSFRGFVHGDGRREAGSGALVILRGHDKSSRRTCPIHVQVEHGTGHDAAGAG